MRHTKGNNKSAAKNSIIPDIKRGIQRGSTHSRSVINHHGNSINGHIIAAVCWEASSHKAARGQRGLGGSRVTRIKSPDSGSLSIMGVSLTTHPETRH